MKKLGKIVLLILTIWPLIYIIIAPIMIIKAINTGNMNYSVFEYHIPTMLIALGLLLIYTIHLYNNRSIRGENKIAWFAGFIFLSSFVMLVYWWKFFQVSKEFERKAMR